nr:ribonuclease H-like domain-containing protein [Tanacetum cinerariifolium]
MSKIKSKRVSNQNKLSSFKSHKICGNQKCYKKALCPDEHLLKFHGNKDSKTVWEAIKNRFGGNKESKKMQKTIQKQQYENFTASRSEGLDKTYDRRGHFARECRAPKNQGNKNGDNTRRVILVEAHVDALVVTDEMGYDWSYQAKELHTDFTLLAHTSSGSSNSDTKINKYNSGFKSSMSKAVTSVHKTKAIASMTSKESMEKPKIIRLDNSGFKSSMSKAVTSVHKTKAIASMTSKESMEKPKII